MPLNDKELADLAVGILASVPEYPRKPVTSACGTRLVLDQAAADLRADAISVAQSLLDDKKNPVT